MRFVGLTSCKHSFQHTARGPRPHILRSFPAWAKVGATVEKRLHFCDFLASRIPWRKFNRPTGYVSIYAAIRKESVKIAGRLPKIYKQSYGRNTVSTGFGHRGGIPGGRLRPEPSVHFPLRMLLPPGHSRVGLLLQRVQRHPLLRVDRFERHEGRGAFF
jgi:hypothetical protein